MYYVLMYANGFIIKVEALVLLPNVNEIFVKKKKTNSNRVSHAIKP